MTERPKTPPKECAIWIIYDPYGSIGFDCDMYVCKTEKTALRVQKRMEELYHQEWCIMKKNVTKGGNVKDL